MFRVTRLAVPVLALIMAADPAVAQDPPLCAASSDTARTAAEVIAAVAEHQCPPGSRLRAAMTVAGQAVVLQRSGICAPESVRTMTIRPTPDTRALDTRALGFTCILATR
ncbi:hypothetical protein [Zavarzinia compransoris]|uniref:Uncharacterized protein n=1 Tax=Zavarzinia compransoris TaxID=1264899 RepID=A0A317E0B6_9PROT|nr:hypothetical protein [Zavarzinia compransoris]PWR20081.1 hypothetical protein DKG75_16740 [Zavarzinia compransoris]TDP44796.1 hypothetical protein DES42_10613 [Zavarzinia compransoris]